MNMQAPGADGENRLFVTKIAPFITQQDISQHFAQFGMTTDVYLPSVPGRMGHKGIAFVSFQDPASVQVAMSNGPHIINGNEVVVDIAAPRQQKGEALAMPQQGGQNQGQQGDRLFVTKVAQGLNRDHMEKYFSQFGELSDCYMPSVPGSGTHKGICFVSYVDPASVQSALAQPQHEIDGHPVVVDVAAPRGAGNPGGKGGGMPQVGGGGGWMGPQTGLPAAAQGNGNPGAPVPGRLFLTKVPGEVTKMDLEAYFGQFGELADVYVHGKGIAFVSMKDAMVAQQILQNKEHYVKPGVSVLVDQALERPSGKGNGKGFAQPTPAQPAFGYAQAGQQNFGGFPGMGFQQGFQGMPQQGYQQQQVWGAGGKGGCGFMRFGPY
mmetsp:Transcript_11308/g.21296  ORF Transcript_11308/g.21296 Transcript_11308/m.21296 type:complete len:379 (+) Transcript_11308:59-1195(+)